MMNPKLIISLFCFFLSLSVFAGNPTTAAIEDYVQKHHEIAIQEMKRSGIPASILLAQAIITSEQGMSNIAAESNNHFATKCGQGWTGDTSFSSLKESVIESCFRSYPDAAASYSDYTNLVMEDKACRDLFQHSYYDFRSWANGLEQCLDASEQAYASKLIKLIKKYDLSKYDSPESFSPVVQKPIIGYEFEIN